MMKRFSPWLMMAVMLLGGGFGAAELSAATEDKPVASAPAELPKLGPAPEWKLKSVDGKEVSSEQFKGKVVIVDFWATWCAPCIEEIPSYIKLQHKYGKDGLVVIGVSEDQVDVSRVKQFTEKHGMNYLVVMDRFDVAAAFGGTEVLPTTILIDRAGQMRDRKMGAQDPVDYEKKVQSLLEQIK
jgi:thiol-disulfide isomerase/thioredoxin